MSRRRMLYLAALVPQLLLLGFMVGSAERTLREGVAVDLEIVAYDPIDPLAGRYMDVRLAAQTVDASLLWGAAEDFVVSAPAYAILTRDTPAQVRNLSAWPPDPGELFLQGTVTYTGETVQLDYGLSRFFFSSDGVDPSLHVKDDGTRPELRLRVRLRDGSHTAETLLVDGVPYAEWNAELAR